MISEIMNVVLLAKVVFCLIYMEFLTRVYYGDPFTVTEQYQSKKTSNVYSTIYKSKYVLPEIKRKKKLLLLLSGSYSLTADVYLRKVMRDILLAQSGDNVLSQYDVVTFENEDINSLWIVPYVAEYIADEMVNREALAIIGFSSGGIVASHVMAQFKDTEFQRTLITYDSPVNVAQNVLSFEGNWVYFMDLIFFVIVLAFYKKVITYNQLVSGSWAKQMCRFICRIEEISFAELENMSRFNTEVVINKCVHIRSAMDPCVSTNLTSKHLDELKNIVPFRCVQKDSWGHCSDMAFGTDYLQYIVREL